MYRFITIAFSHYCEKARWSLQHARVPFKEDAYLPTLHFPAVFAALAGTGEGKADKASSRFSTPLLIRDQQRWTDSTDIARYVDETYGGNELFSAEDAGELDRDFSERLGPHTRRLVYFIMFQSPALLFELAQKTVSTKQSVLLRGAFPLAKQMLRRSMRVDAAGYDRSLARTRQMADLVAQRLGDKQYLSDDRFTMADLTFAALFAPVVLPSNYGAPLPREDELPAMARELVSEFREHPAGQYALRIYRDHR